jgi:hypothetical protein
MTPESQLREHFAKRGIRIGSPTNHDIDRTVAHQALKLRLAVDEFLERQAPKIAKQVTTAYSDVTKATAEDDAAKKAAQILNALDFSGWAVMVNGTNEVLGHVARQAGKQALFSLQITDQSITDHADEAAIEFARARAAELVGMKWVDDELVENPDARWTITDATREFLRSDVTQAIQEGWSNKKLADAVGENYAFSELRSETIARTETARAHMQGNVEGWKASGVVTGKQSLLGSEHDEGDEDECDDNAAAGVVPLEEAFPSGDEWPPYHPRCVCDAVPVLSEEEGEEGDEE